MDGYSNLDVVDEEGGVMGADGVTNVALQIWISEGNRQWLEPQYFRASARGIAKVSRIVPAGPDHPDAFIDACIAFYPGFFRTCPSLAEAELVLNDTELIDFDVGRSNIPVISIKTREKARPRLNQFCTMQARLESVDRMAST